MTVKLVSVLAFLILQSLTVFTQLGSDIDIGGDVKVGYTRHFSELNNASMNINLALRLEVKPTGIVAIDVSTSSLNRSNQAISLYALNNSLLPENKLEGEVLTRFTCLNLELIKYFFQKSEEEFEGFYGKLGYGYCLANFQYDFPEFDTETLETLEINPDDSGFTVDRTYLAGMGVDKSLGNIKVFIEAKFSYHVNIGVSRFDLISRNAMDSRLPSTLTITTGMRF